jgi:uncharacterized protein (DUF2267 family)
MTGNDRPISPATEGVLMTGTTIIALNRSMQVTMEWLHEIRNELKWDDDERVYDATKAVLHAVRDRLPLEDMMKFSAQLPLIMKGMYFDQYDPTDKPLKLRTRAAFLDHVRENFPGSNVDPEEAVRGVMRGIAKRSGPRTLEKISMSMPEDIRDLIVGIKVTQ